MNTTPTRATPLAILPQHPSGTPWPTRQWPRAEPPAAVAAELARRSDAVFHLTPAQGVTYALLVVHRGVLVHERYDAGASPLYLQYSWSMAKSITHALFGVLVREGRIDVHAPAPVPEWQGDARAAITIDQLLRMSSGLAFNEDYVDGTVSDVIAMLQYEGRHDMGAFAAAKPLVHPPGEHWSYASGTTNILCRILKDIVGGGASGMLRFMNDALFEPLGMRSATPKFDTSGTFIGSSFLFATPQDFARFGLLYLRGGSWDGRTVLTRQWVDYARTPTYHDAEFCYGAHWWMNPADPAVFWCGGYDGQRITCFPRQDLVVVRCGRTPAAEMPFVVDQINAIGALFG